MEITEAKSNVSSDTLSSFPPELLTHIFSYGFSKSSSSISSPHNFTQVYSRWRSIAHSSPELWTNLTIELPPALKTEADASKLEERITEWILRSSNLSIDLQVNGPFFRNRQDHPTGLQVDLYTKLYRTIIIDFSNKWRTLIPPYTWEAHDFIASLKELPALQELMLDVRSTCSSSSFPNAPLLYKLALDLPYDPAVTCLDKIIPETIVNLTLTSAPGIIGLFHDFMQDFLHLSQLQHLTHLELAKLGWREPQVLPSTSFPNLQTFSICGLTAGLENLLDALTLPSLQRLSLKTFRVSGGRSRGPTVGPALLHLQKRSRFSLVVLSLTWMLDEEDTAISLDDFFLFLSTANTISELHIVASGETDTRRLMELLSYDHHKPEKRILPHLKIFSARSLYDSKDPDCSYFVEFLRSRWWADDSGRRSSTVRRLEEFDFIGCEVSRKTQEYLEICSKEGLKI